MWRILRAVLAAAVVIGLGSGCAAARRGIAGVRQDVDGNLILILGLCRDFGNPEEVILYEAIDDQGDVGDDVIKLTYTATARLGTYVELPLADLPAGWKANRQPPALISSTAYVARAWNSSKGIAQLMVQGFAFQPTDIPAYDSRKPILYREHIRNDFVAKELDRAGFKSATERYCARSRR